MGDPAPFSENSWAQYDAVNMPGIYRYDVPNVVWDTAVEQVLLTFMVAGHSLEFHYLVLLVDNPHQETATEVWLKDLSTLATPFASSWVAAALLESNRRKGFYFDGGLGLWVMRAADHGGNETFEEPVGVVSGAALQARRVGPELPQ